MHTKYIINALLPMKAHSERIVGKNFKTFNGKPLCFWMIDTLCSIAEITRVVINTDARTILAQHGVQDTEKIHIHDRKSEICGDCVSMNVIINDDIQYMPADIYLMTHVTNPLLTQKTISNALQTFIEAWEKGTCDSLFAVTKHQKRFYTKTGAPVNHDPHNLIRTQDLEPWYEENSNLYIFTRESFSSTNARIGKKPILFETPFLESIDLDEQKEWDLAELIIERENRK